VSTASAKAPLPEKVVARVLTPVESFIRTESAGGIVLVAAAVLAFGWANSPWREAYFALKQFPVSVAAGDFALEKHLVHWVNDLLMAVFFFLVGLEIKRELLVGQLSEWQKAALPAAAALGGMAAPALIYGNTVVMKVAQEAPLTGLHLAACLDEAGIPAGVFNVVIGRGSEVGTPLGADVAAKESPPATTSAPPPPDPNARRNAATTRTTAPAPAASAGRGTTIPRDGCSLSAGASESRLRQGVALGSTRSSAGGRTVAVPNASTPRHVGGTSDGRDVWAGL